MALKINENVYKEIAEQLIEHLKDPKSNLEQLRNVLDYLDNYGDGRFDVILGLDISRDIFGLVFYNKELDKNSMVGGLVRHSDGKYSVHT